MKRISKYLIALLMVSIGAGVTYAYHFWNHHCSIYVSTEKVDGQDEQFKWVECNLYP